MTDISLTPITTGFNLSKINDNFVKTEDVINDEIVHTTGGNNTMSQELDMNSNRIINLGVPKLSSDAARLKDLTDLSLSLSGDIQGVIPVVQPRQTGDGVSIEFDTPATKVVAAASYIVRIDGVVQNPLTDYDSSLTIGKITFTEAPPPLSDIDITFFQPVSVDNLQVVLVVGGLEQPRQTGDGATLVFTTPAATAISAPNLFVYLDGVRQKPLTDYNTGPAVNQVTFTEAPPVGADIDITLFQPSIG